MTAARCVIYAFVALAAGLVGWLVASALASLLTLATTTLEADPYSLRPLPRPAVSPVDSSATRCKAPVTIAPGRTVIRCSVTFITPRGTR